jgi:hypothetical protein
MKFPPRLIIASSTPSLPDHLAARRYALIHAHQGVPNPADILAQAKARIAAMESTPYFPISLGTTLEQDRPFLPNKSTERPKHLPGFVARACAELTAVALILHGHERIRQGPHCIVLAGFALAASPDSTLDSLSLFPESSTPTSGAGAGVGPGAVVAFCAIQPDSGSGESFDETLKHTPLPPWAGVDPRLDEMLEHWSIQPQTRPKAKNI